MSIPYKSFCWSFGTTSFRTKDFNRTIEVQLNLLDEFWNLEENREQCWSGNNALQARYYDFLRARGFIAGNAANRSKDAREKTSGLEDIGLIGADKRLSAAGEALLHICRSNDFESDNLFLIPKDSFLYLKQLLKCSYTVEGKQVRPFIVLLYFLTNYRYITLDEFTYLLPLCTGVEETRDIFVQLARLRQGGCSVDDIIIERLMKMPNYIEARNFFLANEVTEDLICEIGLNRKSRQYDKSYYRLYCTLYEVFMNGNLDSLKFVYSATKAIKIGRWWRNYLFDTISGAAIRKHPAEHLKVTPFQNVRDEMEFKRIFFETMHLFKAKSTLSDYFDLNRRYVKTTDIVLFEDDKVQLDVVPQHFFKSVIENLYPEAYKPSERLYENCELQDISGCLIIREEAIIQGINEEFGTHVSTLDLAHAVLEDKRYRRFQHLIDTRFTDEKLLRLLEDFERRNDKEIREMVTDNADVPTIFEYVLGIVWYKVSEGKGKILDYMKLSLDADLLPKTHAAGGEADLVYEYEETKTYPELYLAFEAAFQSELMPHEWYEKCIAIGIANKKGLC